MLIKTSQLRRAKPEDIRRLARFLDIEEEDRSLEEVIEELVGEINPVNTPYWNLL
jgi:hypothetical protein